MSTQLHGRCDVIVAQVTLSPVGVSMLRRWLKGKAYDQDNVSYDPDHQGTKTYELWRLLEIYGGERTDGLASPFENCEVLLTV